MELKIDFSELEKQFSEEEMKKKIRNSIEALAFEWEGETKRIISDHGCIDTGEFLNSIWHETFEEADGVFGFKGYDGVDYGIFHEYGTIKHFLPFFYYGDTSKPVLADWGRRVLKLSDDEMIAMGGIMVEIDETMPFRKGLIHIESEAEEIFKEEFNK